MSAGYTPIPPATTCGGHWSQLDRQVYLILETNKNILDRCFNLSYLLTKELPPDTACATLVADDIDYQTNEVFVDARDENNNPVDLWPPWCSLAPTSGTTPEGAPIAFPKPDPSDGWYLLTKNVTDSSRGFYTLLYYNEYEAKLRAYLYNISITSDATRFLVSFSLLAKNNGQYEYLTGAVFDIDPNANNWGSGVGVLPQWFPHTWGMVELPILYPMCANLPLENASADASRFASLYEDRMAPDARNVLLQIKIAPYQESKLRADLVGKAVGEAIQQLGPTDTLAIVKSVFSGLKDGKDWYKAADGFADAMKKAAKDHGDEWGATTAELANAAKIYGSTLSGPLAAVGAALSIAGSLLITQTPLQMAIDLALSGQLTGDTISELQFSTWDCYLPGRFSIDEAFAVDRFPKGFRSYIDSKLPRYDRTIGLFGYASHPRDNKICLYRLDRLDFREDLGCNFWIPRPVIMPCDYQEKPWDRYYIIPLPVIRNPFAKIEPFPSDPNGNSESEGTASQAYCKAFFEETVSDLYHGWPNTSHDPSRGFELNVKEALQPGFYQTFTPNPGVRVTSTVWRAQEHWSGDWPGQYTALEDTLYCVIASIGKNRSADKWAVHNFDASNLSPLRDVVYYWNIQYKTFERDGTPRAITSVKLRAPVSVEILRCQYYVDDDAKIRCADGTREGLPAVTSMVMRNLES